MRRQARFVLDEREKMAAILCEDVTSLFSSTFAADAGVKMCKFCCLFDQPIICRETPFIDSPVPTAYGFIEYEDPRDAEVISIF